MLSEENMLDRTQIKEYTIKIYNSDPPPTERSDLKSDLKKIKSFCKKAMSDTRLSNTVSAKWICDNYYVIERESKALMRLCEKELPHISRLYSYMERLFFFTEYVLDNDVVSCFFEVFSRNDFLSDREINNVAASMKYTIISRIRVLCGEIDGDEGFELADAEKSVARERLAASLITSLRKSSVIDFSSYVMGYSPLERMLRLDPSGVYPKMDKPTQLLYREKLEKAAKRTGKSQTELMEEILEKCSRGEGTKRHIGFYLFESPRGEAYTAVLCAVFGILLFTSLYFLGGGHILITAFFAAIPIFECAGAITDRICATLKKPEIIPKMKLDPPFGIPDDCKTLTVITSLLFGGEEDERIFERLEKFYLANRDKNLYFGALCDLPESDEATSPRDAETIERALSRIDRLNRKYDGGFYLFVRGRTFSKTQKKYMGYERKRGAVIELCRLLRGKDGTFSHVAGDKEALSRIKYVFTLDSDTDVGLGQIYPLCGAMAHPLNKPEISHSLGRAFVKSGYAILQPRMSYGLIPSGKTSFCVLKSGAGGKELYAGAAFDVYQSFFSSGTFCGKGIFDVDAFLTVIDGAFPDERVLSHDILEGCLLNCGLCADVILTDSMPQSPISYFKRDHRWARGDVQALAFLSLPVSALSRFKLIRNILRLLAPICAVALMILSVIFESGAAAMGILYMVLPFAWDVARTLFGGNFQQIFRKFTSHVISGIWSGFLNLLYDLTTLFHRAYINLDAIVRSVWRMTVSKRKLLEWTTASEADNVKSGFFQYLMSMKLSIPAGILLAVLSSGGLVRLLGVLFAVCPFVSYLLSRPLHPVDEVSEKRLDTVKEYCRDMWRFFEENVTETQSFLPPDNVQFSPVYAVASRSSPTNIGLYLLSVLCARDMGFTDNDGMYNRISRTLDTVERLEKWNGHLYNWYDNETLEILGTKYVSTVDSGNFVTCLTALSRGLEEYSEGDSRMSLLASRIDKIADDTDFRCLYNSSRDLFYLGRNTESEAFDEGCYDLYMSESRTTGYFAVARGDVPRRHWASLGRILISRGFYIGAASWTGTAFEYFMPALLLPVYPNSFQQEALEFAGREQKRYAARADGIRVWGTSECGFYAFDARMNYQYKAIGVPFLSLKHEEFEERVISPYSSFLMLRKRNDDAERNLENLKMLGMYGKYGFYEALDFNPSRAEDKYAAVESYMAHHVGMSIIACGNFVFDNVFRKRFMSDVRMACASELLEEKIPTDVSIFNDIEKNDVPERHLPAFGMKSTVIRRDRPRIALLGGYKSIARISDCGHVWLERREERRCVAINTQAMSTSDAKPRFFAGVKKSGKVYSQLREYCCDEAEISFEYDRTSATFNITENRELINISFGLSPSACVMYTDISVSGKEKSDSEYIFYFEPVARSIADYKAHPAFCALCFEAEYDSIRRIIIFRRRSKKPGDELYIAVGLWDDSAEFTFETSAEVIFSHGRDLEDALKSEKPLSCSVGACISPALLIKAKPSRHGDDGKMCLMTLCASTREKAVNAFVRAREDHGTRREADGLSMWSIKRAAEASASTMEKDDYLLLEDILRSVSFENGFSVSDSFFSGKYRREDLWKYSVSGDLPVVAVGVKSEKDLKLCGKIIMLHRLCRLYGLMYDTVFLYDEPNVYARPMYNGLRTLTSRYGCDYLVNKNGGIFFVGESEAHGIFKSCASLILDCHCRRGAPADAPLCFPKTEALPLPCGAPRVQSLLSTFGGDFIKNGFVIDKIQKMPPLAYSHIISNRTFGTAVTHDSLGYTWFSNSHERRLTHFENTPYRTFLSETVYLEENGVLYDLCRGSSRVVYGMQSADYYGKAHDIEYRISVTVHGRLPVKSVKVTLSRDARVFYSMTPVLGSHSGSTRGIYICNSHGGTAFGSPFSHLVGYLEVHGTETVLRASSVFGMCGHPAEVNDMVCVGGEGRELTFSLCTVYSEKSLGYISRYIAEAPFEAVKKSALEMTREVMGELISDRKYKSPEELLCGFWIPYQAVFCRFFARSALYQSGGAYGFRDQLQDCRIFFSHSPEIARRHILRCAAHQFEEGDAQHWWHNVKSERGGDAGIRSRCSDDYLWLVFCTCEYVVKTGDYALLDVNVPYLSEKPLSPKEHERYSVPEKSKVCESVYMHCKRAVDLFMERGLGAHGMPYMGSCDWNDGFSAVGEGGKGESVWLAFFGRIVIEMFVYVAEKRGEDTLLYREFSDTLGRNTDLYAYNGKWYVRGFYDDGTPLGDKVCDECRIDLLPQAFSSLCDKAISVLRPDAYRNPKKHIKSALDSAYNMLYDKENRILRLFYPPFDKSEKNPGYIKGYAPGLRENGGQYTHGAVWGAMGFWYGGMEERAMEICSALCPAVRCLDKELFEKYKTEPYVLCGDVYANPSHPARGGWSWYTGSAAWYGELCKKVFE